MNNLYYDRTDVSEKIDVNKTSESKECDIFSLLVFFKWKIYVSNRCLEWLSWCINNVYKL